MLTRTVLLLINIHSFTLLMLLPITNYCLEVFQNKNVFSWIDWIEQCFTSPPTQYRLYGRRFLQVKRPNQQYQSTKGTYSMYRDKSNIQQVDMNTTHNKSPSLHWYGVTRGMSQLNVSPSQCQRYDGKDGHKVSKKHTNSTQEINCRYYTAAELPLVEC